MHWTCHNKPSMCRNSSSPLRPRLVGKSSLSEERLGVALAGAQEMEPLPLAHWSPFATLQIGLACNRSGVLLVLLSLFSCYVALRVQTLCACKGKGASVIALIAVRISSELDAFSLRLAKCHLNKAIRSRYVMALLAMATVSQFSRQRCLHSLAARNC